jgi:hypothetical protein
MSWLDDIVDFGSTALNWLGGNSIAGNLAKTAILGYGLNQVTKSINQDNATKNKTSQPDPGVRLQVDPDPQHKIPVVYGQAFLGGIVTDAYLVNNNSRMIYVLTICEKTGNLNLGAGAASVITFKDIYVNDERVIFKGDGLTIDYTVDRTGTRNDTLSGLVSIIPFNGGSNSPTLPYNYATTGSNILPAYDWIPDWTSNYTMDDLVFAIVVVDYNKEKNSTQLPKIEFQLSNSMSLPGDCLYDMLTNVRYGAGIDPTEVFSS